MVKLADTRVLEARAARREGSSPFTRTIFIFKMYKPLLFVGQEFTIKYYYECVSLF